MIDGVHIWRAALDEAGWPEAERLPAPERERAAAFLREEPRRRWVAARWALRQVLAGYLDRAPAQIEFGVGEAGKPRLPASDGIEFNLSHSGGLALVAVTEGRTVGVDVESIEPRPDLTAMAERALGAEEAAAVRHAAPADRSDVFYAAWTRHEARLKCLGVTGASLRSRPPNEPDPDRVAVENLPLFLCPPMRGKGTAEHAYAAAVAVAAPEVGPIECRSLRAG